MATSLPQAASMPAVEVNVSSPSNNLSADSSGPPTKRCKQDGERLDLTGRSADKLVRKLELFSDSQVSVHVGGKDFKLPKALLCFYSPYFQAVFNDGFKETAEQEVTIPDYDQATFELVVQWMFNEEIVLQSIANPLSTEDSTALDNSKSTDKVLREQHQTTQYLQFINFADYLDLLGNFQETHEVIRNLVSKNNCRNLQSSHVRLIMELPANHPIRVYMIELVAWVYTDAILSGSPFAFQTEMAEMDDFAAELMRGFTKVFTSDKGFNAGRGYSCRCFDILAPAGSVDGTDRTKYGLMVQKDLISVPQQDVNSVKSSDEKYSYGHTYVNYSIDDVINSLANDPLY